MKLSGRTAWDLAESRLSRVLGEARARGAIDLTESNPTRVGLSTPARVVTELASPASAVYEPEARGLRAAREAVAGYYEARGERVRVEQIVLTASTSEAYGFLFKLLCDPGDAVLVPTPSYPLFGYLAALEHVETRSYPLLREERFRVDLAALERRIDDRTRAIVVVAPNNPTGTLLHEDDAAGLERIACSHGLALIVDEVFVDYLHRAPAEPHLRTRWTSPGEAVTFVLNGLSKACCAPQLKLGWIVAVGPERRVAPALGRLELVADTYLSVGTPVQRALPFVLGERAAIQAELLGRIRRNLVALDARLAASSHGVVRRLPADGGWTGLIELPRLMDEEAWVAALAERAEVLVQPGYYFDIEGGRTFALSLIAEEDRFVTGVERLLACVGEELG